MTISFGPYHHGKPELQAAEKLKNCGMRTYISEAGKSIEDFSVRYLKRMPTLEAVMLLVQGTNMMMRNLGTYEGGELENDMWSSRLPGIKIYISGHVFAGEPNSFQSSASFA